MFCLLGLDVVCDRISSPEFLPAPAMGNMRQDNPEYGAKFAEKQAKLALDSLYVPALGVPSRIRLLFHSQALYGTPEYAMVGDDPAPISLEWTPAQGGVSGAAKMLSGLPLKRDSQVIIYGLHPTTHTRLLSCWFIREMGKSLPLVLRKTRHICFNPWKELGVIAEYPTSAKQLKLGGIDPVLDSYELLCRVGVPTSCLS